jgi:hypothetical protein
MILQNTGILPPSLHCVTTQKTMTWIFFAMKTSGLENHVHLLLFFCLCWATGWTVGVLGFDSWWVLGIFLFTTASRMVLGPIQPPIQWVPEALSLGVKWPECEADHSPLSVLRSRMCGANTSTPPIRLHGTVLS